MPEVYQEYQSKSVSVTTLMKYGCKLLKGFFKITL